MIGTNSSLVVVYSTDENYAVHTYVSLNSLLDSCSAIEKIDIYIIENRLDESTKLYFVDLIEKYNIKSREVHFIDFLDFEKFVIGARPCGSLSTYGRLFLSKTLNESKVLYIDCDTIVLDNLEPLFNTCMDGYAIAGVQDIVSISNRTPLGLDCFDRYINAGVSLINLDYWRENDGTQKCLDFINKFNGKVPFEDQGTVNGVFRGKIKIIEPRYNFMNHMIGLSADKIALIYGVDNYYDNYSIKKANKSPAIVHYTAGYYLRPWYKNSNHPLKSVYIKYFLKSPWCHKMLTKAKNKNGIKQKIKHYFNKLMPYVILRLFYKNKRDE